MQSQNQNQNQNWSWILNQQISATTMTISNCEWYQTADNIKSRMRSKKKKLIYKMIQMWHWCLKHLNASDIIWLSEDSQSEIKIKRFKFLSFCETCKLTESKKKISHQSIQRFKQHDEFLHFDMINDEKTLENLNDFVSNFSKAKYFILITDNITWHHWMFFVQWKNDIYHVIIYFINHLINQNMTLSVFACSDWTLKIDFKELQFFMSTKNCKWESSAAYNQHQDEISEQTIQIILCWMRAVMIQTKLFLKLWAKID